MAAQANEFVVRLINSVKNRRCLYDNKDVNYFNKVGKELAWEEVAVETNHPSLECKLKWKGLREKFMRELRKQELPSSSNPEIAATWEFFNEMLFLREAPMQRLIQYNTPTLREIHSCTQSGCLTTFTEDTLDESSLDSSSPPLKKPKGTMDDLLERLSKFLEKLENQMEAAHINDDQIFMQTIVDLMKDLPEDVKDKIKSETFARVMIVRASRRSCYPDQ